MGYYVTSTEADFTIPPENLDAAYEAVCELNTHNNLKRGGSFPALKNLPDDKPRPDKWFSWMDWNYQETCPDLKAVLKEVGFYVGVNPDGGLSITEYDSKSGQEDLFLEAIAPFATEGSYIMWRGEEGEQWQNVVKDGTLAHLKAVVFWV